VHAKGSFLLWLAPVWKTTGQGSKGTSGIDTLGEEMTVLLREEEAVVNVTLVDLPPLTTVGVVTTEVEACTTGDVVDVEGWSKGGRDVDDDP